MRSERSARARGTRFPISQRPLRSHISAGRMRRSLRLRDCSTARGGAKVHRSALHEHDLQQRPHAGVQGSRNAARSGRSKLDHPPPSQRTSIGVHLRRQAQLDKASGAVRRAAYGAARRAANGYEAALASPGWKSMR